MSVEALPTLEDITKQLQEANAKKQKKDGGEVTEDGTEGSVVADPVDGNPDPDSPADAAGAVADAPVAEGKEEAAPVEEAAAAPEKPKDPWSKRFAALTRIEKQARQQQKLVEQQMAELEQRRRAIEEKEARFVGAKTPLDALRAHGYSYEEASTQILGQPFEKEPDPVEQRLKSHLDPVAQKIAAMEEKLARAEEAAKQLQQDRQAQAEREIRYGIKAFAADGEYPYIKGLGAEAEGMVYDFMVEYFEKHKQGLTYKQACDKVEGYYKRIAEIGRASPDKVPGTTAPTKAKVPAAPPAKTLTQSHTTTTRSKQDLDKLSDQEAKKQIATMLKFR